MAVSFGTSKQWVVTSTRKDINKSVSFKVQAETEKLAALQGLSLARRKCPLYELASVKVEG